MTTQARGRQGRHLIVRRFWLSAALLLFSGCQMPPARPAGCTPRAANTKRSHVLVRQILCDTGAEIVRHPLHAGRTLLADQAAWLGSAGRGIFGKRIGMRLHGMPPPLSPPLYLPQIGGDKGGDGPDPALLATDLQPASVQLYRDGPAALTVLEHMIDSAECRIDVLMYLWEDDVVGWSIAQRLAGWASPQRRLRILVDGGANLIFIPSSTDDLCSGSSSCSRRDKPRTAGEVNRVVCWLARQPCVELVRVRNPCAHFDHRKIVLIDGRCAWTGGRNFTQSGFFARHDLTFTVQGPLVADWQSQFESYWRDQGGTPACPPECQAGKPDLLANAAGRVVVCQAGKPDLLANAAGRLVANAPTHHGLRHALYDAIDHACCFAYLENPYMTDNGMITKLARARRRGVDVRIVFTIQSDSASINHTNKVTANRLLAAGVRVYLYPGRVHTKAALVDGCWAYLGSGNFDFLSLHRNHELGVVFGPGPIIGEINQVLFQPDFNPAWELHAPLPLTFQDYVYEMMAAFFL